MIYIDKDLCTGCGKCIGSCPFAALSILNKKAVVDESLCRLCGVCLEACPLGAISMPTVRQTADINTNVADHQPNEFSAFAPLFDHAAAYPGPDRPFGNRLDHGAHSARGDGQGRGRGRCAGKARRMGRRR